MKTNIQITGIEDVNEILRTIAPREARNLMRTTVHDMAKGIRDDARGMAPRDQGDLHKSIAHKRARVPRDQVQSNVVVAKKAFYWRFLEYGDGPDGVEHAFFLRALRRLQSEITTRYLASFTRKLEARLKRARKG